MESYEARRARPPAPGSRHYRFLANAKLASEIESLAEGKNKSAILRMLVWLGLEQYKLNGMTGKSTGKKRKANAELQKAQAESEQARREYQKAGLAVPLLVPLDFDDDD